MPGGVLVALVQRGVDVRDATAHERAQTAADGGDVPAGDRVQSARLEQCTDLGDHGLRRLPAVDVLDLDPAAVDPGRAVELVGGHLAHRHARGAEDPAGALHGDDHADAVRAPARQQDLLHLAPPFRARGTSVRGGSPD